MSQQAVRPAARRSAWDAQALLCKQRAVRDRRLEGLAVAVLTALGERDAAIRDTERRAGCGTPDHDHRAGPVVAGRGRLVWQWPPHGAGGHPVTPTRARPAGRQQSKSARRQAPAIRAATLSALRPRAASAQRPGPWGDDA